MNFQEVKAYLEEQIKWEKGGKKEIRFDLIWFPCAFILIIKKIRGKMIRRVTVNKDFSRLKTESPCCGWGLREESKGEARFMLEVKVKEPLQAKRATISNTTTTVGNLNEAHF